MSEQDTEQGRPEGLYVAEGVEAFHAVNPETHRAQLFEPGDELPVELARRLRPEMVEGEIPEEEHNDEPELFRPSEVAAMVKEQAADLAKGSVLQSDVDKAVEQARAEGVEQGKAEAQSSGEVVLFDPSGHNATVVYDYLDALPDTRVGHSEWDRVLLLEQESHPAKKDGDTPGRSSAVPERVWSYEGAPEA